LLFYSGEIMSMATTKNDLHLGAILVARRDAGDAADGVERVR